MAANPPLARGVVFRATVGGAPLLGVVVSSDARNNELSSVLYARVTPIGLPALASIVPLGDADPVQGAVMLDFTSVVSVDELSEVELETLGAVTEATMEAIDRALRIVFGLAP
jgi:mRNA-degrading endonuclease toxin of MazEF toxin-antitoxin module